MKTIVFVILLLNFNTIIGQIYIDKKAPRLREKTKKEKCYLSQIKAIDTLFIINTAKNNDIKTRYKKTDMINLLHRFKSGYNSKNIIYTYSLNKNDQIFKVEKKTFFNKNKNKIINHKKLLKYFNSISVKQEIQNIKKIYIIDIVNESNGFINLYPVFFNK